MPAQGCWMDFTASLGWHLVGALPDGVERNSAFDAFDEALYFPVGLFINNAKNARAQRDTCVGNLNEEKAQHLSTKKDLENVKQELAACNSNPADEIAKPEEEATEEASLKAPEKETEEEEEGEAEKEEELDPELIDKAKKALDEK